MEPQIIFLGTGGDSVVVGKQVYASGGIIIQVDGFQFLVDPGPGSLVRATQGGINLRETTAIFVSHSHLNHSNDLNAVISAMTYGSLDHKGVLIASKSVTQGSDDSPAVLHPYFARCVERTISLDRGQRVGIEDVEIRAVFADHSDPSTIGFKFFTPKFTLVYSSDTKYSEELIKDYLKTDILLLNCVYPMGDDKDRSLLNGNDVIRIIEKVAPRLAIITHFGVRMYKADPLHEAREIQKETGVQVLAAKDGMIINPVSYSADLKQKTLNLYK